MGGSKDVCGSCSAPFYGRQQFLPCAGPCKRRFHCKCINVVEEDYEYLMADGKSSYKCPSCAKRLDESGNKVSDDSAAILLEETELSPVNVIPGTDTNLPELVVLLCKKIDDLTKVVKTLKTDNESLHIHLSRNSELLRKLCLPEERPVAPAVPPKHYAAVLKKPVPFVSHHVNFAANDDRSRATERPPSMEGDDVAANSQHTRAGLVDDEDFTTVTRKKRPQRTEGVWSKTGGNGEPWPSGLGHDDPGVVPQRDSGSDGPGQSAYAALAWERRSAGLDTDFDWTSELERYGTDETLRRCRRLVKNTLQARPI
ncbi:hypothetical protein HPB47_020364 [Ixodes persulcatus]|uniref:Uncharacterized protein n=1 Tax=Ixodes persulcatus TaxID=34615 RepID=A0AC60QJ16_IXOPE|nr:hypothetical protein HPB47_020364 [Ixodes persulcatus]